MGSVSFIRVLLSACLLSLGSNEENFLSKDSESWAGHLKPFGTEGAGEPVDEVEGFLNTADFFSKYGLENKPVVFRGAAKLSKAFDLWTDDYFLESRLISDVETVQVEERKKEKRMEKPAQLTFKKFVRSYNSSDTYMVDKVPDGLKEDVLLPPPLQCATISAHMLVTNVMWYSSGGTSSVVHVDTVDNINCLFRGVKELVFVEPHKWGDYVDLDGEDFSSMDVDAVDFNKFPGMAKVKEYRRVRLEAGDCVFIPFMWIHQLRSIGSNLAVNVWWDHEKAQSADLSGCPNKLDPQWTLNKGVYSHSEGDREELFMEHIRSIVNETVRETNKPLPYDSMYKTFANKAGFPTLWPNRKNMVEQHFYNALRALDESKDDEISYEEVQGLSEETWLQVARYLADAFIEVDGDRWDKLGHYEHSQAPSGVTVSKHGGTDEKLESYNTRRDVHGFQTDSRDQSDEVLASSEGAVVNEKTIDAGEIPKEEQSSIPTHEDL